ncbi:MFS transporter [Sphingopyxis kveilinensis]|uniref:MFS transporter n=1 Tax=Sphingopyxis kveilinensis TaxID=3114367 RepID=UPI0030CA7EAC
MPAQAWKDVAAYKGWRVAAAGFLLTLIAIGSTTYGYGLFVTPIEQEYGLSRTMVNYGLMLLLVGMTAWGPIVGRLIDRSSSRHLFCLGGVAIGIGLWIIALSDTVTVFALAIFFLISFGAVTCGSLGTVAVASRWFFRLRGRVLGIMAVATSAGGFLVVPFIAHNLEAYGWRTALMIQGALVPATIILLTLLLVRDRPADVGQFVDGASSPAVEEEAAPRGSKDQLLTLLKTKDFWLLAIGAGLLLGSDQALLISLIPYAIDRGFSAGEAAALMSVLTGSAICGKLVVGWIADLVDKRQLFAIVCLINIGFLIVLIGEPGWGALLAACALCGAAIGGVYPAWHILIGARFGSASFGFTLGLMFWLSLPLALGAIQVAGMSRDHMGSYDLAFQIFIAGDVIAAIAVGLMSGAATRPTARSVRG